MFGPKGTGGAIGRPGGLIATLALALAAAGLSSGSPVSAAPSTPTAMLSGVQRPITSWTLGLNGENAGGPVYSNAGFANALAGYGAGTLRYPGGTAANFWDWRQGWYQPNGPWPGEPGNRIDNTLATFASIVTRTGATPVFDVNVVTWQGRIASDADVPAMIADTLSLLRAARDAGIPVLRVELGNELYLSGPSPGNIQYQRRFPTPVGYAAVVDRFAVAVAAEFPSAKVAGSAAITDYVNGLSPRRANWNAGLLPNLHSTSAVTLHLNVRVHDPNLSPANVLGTMVRQMRALSANQLPQLRQYGLDAWVTEFNMADETPGSVFQGTWLHGMAVGTIALSLVSLPGVGQLAMHNVTGNARAAALFRDNHGFGASGAATTPYALTASGTVLGFVQDALRGATTAQALTFANAPALGWQDAPGLLGVRADAGTHPSVILLNLTGQPTTVDVSGVVTGAFSYRRAWAPSINTKVTGPVDVMRDSGTATASISLPAYAVALLAS